MYRIYDKENKCWIKDGVYLSPNPNSNLYMLEKTLFGEKLKLVSAEKYAIHKAIDLYDKKDVLVYEGDIVKAEVADNKIVTGVVIYAHELSAYIILCDSTSEYFTLGTEVCKYIEVIGNVFDNEEEEDGQQSL